MHPRTEALLAENDTGISVLHRTLVQFEKGSRPASSIIQCSFPKCTNMLNIPTEYLNQVSETGAHHIRSSGCLYFLLFLLQLTVLAL